VVLLVSRCVFFATCCVCKSHSCLCAEGLWFSYPIRKVLRHLHREKLLFVRILRGSVGSIRAISLG
jgi:hypothetical protein